MASLNLLKLLIPRTFTKQAPIFTVQHPCRHYAKFIPKRKYKPTKESQKNEAEEDELEMDLEQIGYAYKDHVSEVQALKEREKHLIVKQKYFKEHFPNFLTWDEKQQIRYLYNNDPDNWTIDKLSEGFPALPETIIKLVKSNWLKKNDNKIQRHDESVEKTWVALKKKKLDLPEELRTHLAKFTSRKRNVVVNLEEMGDDLDLNVPKTYKKTDFSEIITGYEELTKSNEKLTKSNDTLLKLTDGSEELHEKTLEETYVPKKSSRRQEYKRFQDLEVTQEKSLQTLNQDDLKQEVQQVETFTETKIIELTNPEKYQQPKYVATTKSRQDYEFLNYPEKIRIPNNNKNRNNKNTIYKLKDCYYDNDGEFLYRVPGME